MKTPSLTSIRPFVVSGICVFAFFCTTFTGAYADTLYSSGNFADLSPWTISSTGTAEATVTSSAPTTGSDTASLHLLNAAINSTNLNNPSPDSLSATLAITNNTGFNQLQINFSLKLAQVMDSVSGKASTNAFDIALRDSSNNVLFRYEFSRWSGGTLESRIGYGDADAYPVSGYVDVTDDWYNISISVVDGVSTMTVTGLDGAVVHSGDAPYGPVSQTVTTEALSGSLTSALSLEFKAGMSWASFNADANVSNLDIQAVPEPNALLTVMLGLSLLFFLRRRPLTAMC